MAKAKIKEDPASIITQAYIQYILTHGKQPTSVFSFTQDIKLNEAEFYNHFGSFEGIDKHIFNSFYTNTMEVLTKSKDFQSFDARNKLLSFYYTFFEVLKANRSYAVFALKSYKTVQAITILADLRRNFRTFLEDLNIETIDLKNAQLENIKDKGVRELIWNQLLMTIKFWLEDNSKGFEKTDIFIEKSVNASFDILDTTPLKSVIDFGKFLFKEKVNPNF